MNMPMSQCEDRAPETGKDWQHGAVENSMGFAPVSNFFFKENISFVLNYKFLLVYLLCNTKDKIIQFNIPGSQWAHWV